MSETPILTFNDWRTMRWGGPCRTPPSDDEVMEYRQYLDKTCGLPRMDW